MKNRIVYEWIHAESRKNSGDELIGKVEIETQMWRTKVWLLRGKGVG